MERTISGMMGKGAINHNTRAFNAKNVDPERSIYNVQFCNTSIKKVYHELFDEALERYNAKQKRSDRKIDNYYEKIRQSKPCSANAPFRETLVSSPRLLLRIKGTKSM